MKKLILITLLSALTFTLFSQNFAPVGAEWYFGNGPALSADVGYFYYEINSDTIINGKYCTYFDDSSNQPLIFYYESNDSVYWRSENDTKFHMFYNFNASKGDVWTITGGSVVNPSTSISDTFLVSVDTTYSAVYNGVSLKTLEISTINAVGNVWLFDGLVVEKFGHLSLHRPWHGLEEINLTGLRCYSDSAFGQYTTVSYSCDSTWMAVGINDLNIHKLKVYPNPASDQLTIDATELNLTSALQTLEIYNLQGQLVEQYAITSNNNLITVDVSNLNNGVFFYTVKSENQPFASGKFSVLR